MIRIVSEHSCGRHHRDPAAFTRCAWPGAQVTGRGFLAVVSSCDGTAVALFQRLEPARIHLEELRIFGCSRACTRDHELLAIDLDADRPADLLPVATAPPPNRSTPMTDPSPQQRLAAGHAAQPEADAILRGRAAAHRPELDEEADRMRRLGDRLPTGARLALSYHDSARQAAETIASRKSQNQ